MKILLFLLGPLGWLAAFAASARPEWVEKYYSEGLYKLMMSPVSRISAGVPFSLGELIVVLAGLIFIYALAEILIDAVRFCLRRPKSGFWIRRNGQCLLMVISLGYFFFIMMWGLNYYREPWDRLADLEIKQADSSEIAGLCTELIKKANDYRKEIPEDGKGVMTLGEDKVKIFLKASEGFRTAAEEYSQLGGNYGRAKPVFFSRALSFMGITGIYFPFTGEANVNIDIPDMMIPSTICHEMAHQRGFAREEEANYIAYLTCQDQQDQKFKYSGVLLALIYSMNALDEQNPEAASQLRETYSPGLNRDLTEITAYWQLHRGKIENWSTQFNDQYLKSNRQTQGVKSYNGMVDLLLAERRKAMR
ncbi:hypothetical protein Sgly_0290 [Syntrophobotulus glycolicus DSM 8271]|uniref:DUF3810 domain-containing protein n=1 Tax=Syntrophobotulus glycolicus (strain DSM 8271 / FlGlyR) TaxID=645991 RepID=F0SWW7_SYNGF|nr:DUF3810 domain-containing protein [Syntrophobotulus glycolicus]ADY54657.1 hypothetical protein Sgly_0290 [Syntrophobotulus glycolicus DSM 8271]